MRGECAFNIFCEDFGLLHIFYYYGRGPGCRMGKGSPCLFMSRLAMDDDRIIFLGDLGGPVPNLLYEGAGGIVFFGLDADGTQFFFNLQGSPESRYDHDVFCAQLFKRNELPAISVLEAGDAPELQLRINLWVMDHLA